MHLRVVPNSRVSEQDCGIAGWQGICDVPFDPMCAWPLRIPATCKLASQAAGAAGATATGLAIGRPGSKIQGHVSPRADVAEPWDHQDRRGLAA